MKKFAIASIVTGGLAAALFGFAAPAIAAPALAGSAEQTINELQAQGYHVIVTRLGSTPLAEASVVAVRPGHDVPRISTGEDRDVYQQSVAYTTVYVDVK